MSLSISIFSLVLDGWPFLPMQLATFNRLRLDWHWYICEGAAANKGSTAWCQAQAPRLSRDGSCEFLNSLAGHPRVTVLRRQWWSEGKDEMCEAALAQILEPCVLLEVDVDELWESAQIEAIHALLSGDEFNCARFDCRYFLGPNVILANSEQFWLDHGYWLRAWRFIPSMRFKSHEPPFLEGVNGPNEACASNAETRKRGLVFEHWSLVFREQVEYKSSFYGYAGLLERWERLNHHPGPWPVALKNWPPWEGQSAELACKP